jgi:hypothetical protein
MPHSRQIFGCAVDDLVDLGVLDASEPDLVSRFEDRVQPVMRSAGLPVL